MKRRFVKWFFGPPSRLAAILGTVASFGLSIFFSVTIAFVVFLDYRIVVLWILVPLEAICLILGFAFLFVLEYTWEVRQKA